MSWAFGCAPPVYLICFRTRPMWSPGLCSKGHARGGLLIGAIEVTLGPLMVDVAGLELTPEDRDVLRHPLVGSVLLFARNFADSPELAKLVADIHAVRTPSLVVGVDHEGGRVQRFRKD